MSFSNQDHYRVLQVVPAANALVIQAAYRVLARIFHPDVDGDAADMKQINAAWEVLGDPRRRAQYDIERAGKHLGFVAPQPSATPVWEARRTNGETHAGPPRGLPYGPVLTFGRYEGWSLGQVARVDRPFLEWLRGVQAGRTMRGEIDAVLRNSGIPGVDRRRYDLERERAQFAGATTGTPVGRATSGWTGTRTG
jgi:curved DNA-binding protein CbpA